MAHAQARINTALNDYAVDISTDTIDGASALGVSNQLFARAVGSQMDGILTSTQIVNLKHATSTAATPTTSINKCHRQIYGIFLSRQKA